MRTTESTTLRLDRHVSLGEPEAGTLILVSDRTDSKPLRLKGHSVSLAKRLVEGCAESELVAELEMLSGSRAPLDEIVTVFVAQLRSAGMLEGDNSHLTPHLDSTVHRISLPNPDRLVKPLGQWLCKWPKWLHWVVWISMAIGAVVVAFLALAYNPLPSLFDLSFPASLLGLFLLPAWVVTHETAHAIACRAAGCPVSGAGIVLRRFSLPSFFVDTRALYLLPGRVPKVAVALAGPLVDVLCTATLLAALAWGAPGVLVKPALQLATFCIMYSLFFNLSLFRRSDGSNALASALGDPFLPARAFVRSPAGASSRFALHVYRACAVAFGAAAICLLVLVFLMTYATLKPKLEAIAVTDTFAAPVFVAWS